MATLTRRHTHHAVAPYRQTVCWTQCVQRVGRGRACDGRAHGNIAVQDICRCGATREMEINGGTWVSSGWQGGVK